MRVSIGALAALAGATVASAALFQTSGHTDIRFTYENGTPALWYYLDLGSVVGGQAISAANPMGGTPVTVSGGSTKIRYKPDQLVTYIPGPSVGRPAGATWDFTGVSAGDPLWFIPQSQDVNKPWTGFSTESVTSSQFSNIKYQLTAFSGPGQMSVTTTGSFGSPTVYFRTSNGLTAADIISVSAGTHAHFNWYFTEMGTYTFDLTGIGTRTAAAGGGTVSITETFTFQVVPTPGSAALLGMGGLIALRRRRA